MSDTGAGTVGPHTGWDKPPLGLTLLAGRLVLGILLFPFMLGRLLFGQFGTPFLVVAFALAIVQLVVIFGLLSMHRWALYGAIAVLVADALVALLSNFWPLSVVDAICVWYLLANRREFD